MNAPEFDATADVTPVTVWMSPAQAAQFEVLLAQVREERPRVDENKLSDEIFAAGMQALSQAAADHEVATAAYIAELRTRIAVLEAPTVFSTPDCIRRLQEVMVGSGACLTIDDGEVLVEVTMGPAAETINVSPDELVELVDALTTIQNFREIE